MTDLKETKSKILVTEGMERVQKGEFKEAKSQPKKMRHFWGSNKQKNDSREQCCTT